MRVAVILAFLLPVSLSAESRLGATDNVAAIRSHRSGVDVRWENKIGRALSELAILSVAREHDQPYEWSLHEMEAIAVGLDPAVIDIVRNRKPLAGIGDKETTIIEVARELGAHRLTPDTYSRAVTTFTEPVFVDIVTLMGNYSATATRLSAVNQQLPPGWKQLWGNLIEAHSFSLLCSYQLTGPAPKPLASELGACHAHNLA